MNLLLYLLRIVLLLTLLSPGTVRAQTSPPQDLERYIQETMRDWRVPGVAVAVIKDDSLVFAKSFGVRELGQPAPVTTETLFPIGSMGKAFTAATLGVLVDEGWLGWDDPVMKHLPEFVTRDPWINRHMSVRDLLTHRVGLPGSAENVSSNAEDRSDALHRIRFIETDGSFRSKYSYSSLMYIVAGEVAAAITSMPWEEILQQRIFAPLGMRDSRAFPAQLPPDANKATPHVYLEGAVHPIEREPGYVKAAAGGIESNVFEMSRWLRMMLNEGVFEGDTVLSPSVVREIFTPQILAPTDSDLNPETNLAAYGLGWGIRDYRGQTMVTHGGQVAGATAHIRMIPDEKLAVVALTNSINFYYPRAITYRAVDEWMGYPETDWSGKYRPIFEAALTQIQGSGRDMVEGRVAGTQPSHPPEAYAGVYTHPAMGDVHITWEESVLRFRFAGQSGTLEHYHYDTFRLTNEYVVFNKHDWLTFHLGSKGRPASLTFRESGFNPDGVFVRSEQRQ